MCVYFQRNRLVKITSPAYLLNLATERAYILNERLASCLQILGTYYIKSNKKLLSLISVKPEKMVLWAILKLITCE